MLATRVWDAPRRGPGWAGSRSARLASMGFAGRLRARASMALSDDGLSLGTLSDHVGTAHEGKTLVTTSDGLRWTANELAGAVDHAAQSRHMVTQGLHAAVAGVADNNGIDHAPPVRREPRSAPRDGHPESDRPPWAG